MKTLWVLSRYLLVLLLLAACRVGGEGAKPISPSPSTPLVTTLSPKETMAASTPTTMQKANGTTPLVVFCAGSLILPFADLEAAYEALHPEVDVRMECHGSIQVIRHVTDLHVPIDVVATADHALIPMLMYPVPDPDTGKPYASWYIRFAGNKLSLAYTPGSKLADQINPQNWYQVIAQPGVRLGIADMRFDASGYRALMALKLAELSAGTPDIFNHVIKGRFRYPISAFDEEGYSEISVPEIVEPLSDSGILIRGSSIQLIALLESGDLDYAFEYESVIHQHGLEMVGLPDEVNLGVEALAEFYRQVEVKIDFQRFASVKPVFIGEPIGYGLTIPSNAPHPDQAQSFIEFLLGLQGREIMQSNDQPVLDPLPCEGIDRMPQRLKTLCQVTVN